MRSGYFYIVTPLLLPDDNHDVRLFDDLREGVFVDETPQLPLAFNLPAARGFYAGKIQLQVEGGSSRDSTVFPLVKVLTFVTEVSLRWGVIPSAVESRRNRPRNAILVT